MLQTLLQVNGNLDLSQRTNPIEKKIACKRALRKRLIPPSHELRYSTIEFCIMKAYSYLFLWHSRERNKMVVGIFYPKEYG